jgi:hypothetical protein
MNAEYDYMLHYKACTRRSIKVLEREILGCNIPTTGERSIISAPTPLFDFQEQQKIIKLCL